MTEPVLASSSDDARDSGYVPVDVEIGEQALPALSH